MKKVKLSIVAAVAKNRVIGASNKLPWYIPEELKRFKALTMGHPIIMGRKTYQSIGKSLPGRLNIVITRDPKFKAEGCLIVNSLKEAVNQAKEKENQEVFIIGGGQIYKQALPLVDRLYLTIVEGNFSGDIFFPDYSDFKKKVSEEKKQSAGYRYKFLTLER